MSEICELPPFNINQAAQAVKNQFGIEASLSTLNGERDLNYLVTAESGQFVFKIANREESYAMLECQHQVLQHLATHRVMPQLASSIESLNGSVIETISSDDGSIYFCRLLSYVEGQLLSTVQPQSVELLSDIGKTLALIDRALHGFNHQALKRPLLWNMNDGLKTVGRFNPLLDNVSKRKLVAHFESQFHATVLPLIKNLRRGVIHNDANDNNVLVYEDNKQRVNGIIDFGDMVYSWLAVEPAVAAAYAMLGKDEPLDVAAALIEGYHNQLPLLEPEISALYHFITMRLCMSVCICAYQQSVEADNEYLSISEQPAWELLHRLRDISPAAALEIFHDACVNRQSR